MDRQSVFAIHQRSKKKKKKSLVSSLTVHYADNQVTITVDAFIIFETPAMTIPVFLNQVRTSDL